VETIKARAIAVAAEGNSGSSSNRRRSVVAQMRKLTDYDPRGCCRGRAGASAAARTKFLRVFRTATRLSKRALRVSAQMFSPSGSAGDHGFFKLLNEAHPNDKKDHHGDSGLFISSMMIMHLLIHSGRWPKMRVRIAMMIFLSFDVLVFSQLKKLMVTGGTRSAKAFCALPAKRAVRQSRRRPETAGNCRARRRCAGANPAATSGRKFRQASAFVPRNRLGPSIDDEPLFPPSAANGGWPGALCLHKPVALAKKDLNCIAVASGGRPRFVVSFCFAWPSCLLSLLRNTRRSPYECNLLIREI